MKILISRWLVAASIVVALGMALPAFSAEDYFFDAGGSRISLTLRPELYFISATDDGSGPQALTVLREGAGAAPGVVLERLAGQQPQWLIRLEHPAAAGPRLVMHNKLRALSGVRYAGPVYSLGGENLAVPTAEVLVQPKPGAADAVKAKAYKLGLVYVDQLVLDRPVFRFRLSGNTGSTVSAARDFFNSGLVEWAQPELLRRVVLRLAPNDPYYDKQWHLNNTGQEGAIAGNDVSAEEAWDGTFGDASVKIAVLDDGVDINHEDFAAGKVVAQYDYLDDDNDPSPVPGSSPTPNDPVGHGTSVAGVAAASGNNGLGVVGACPNCSLIAVRVIGISQSGGYISDWTIGQAFRFAVDQGAAVISNSWGPDLGDPTYAGDEPNRIPATPAMKNAINYAVQSGRGGLGTMVIFAAGNSNCDIYLDGTASLDVVLAVGASTDQGTRAYYSNYGDELAINTPSNGLGGSYDGARTSGIWTTDRPGSGGYNNGNRWYGDSAGNYTNSFGGTSSSAPLAAGIAGLVFSANPNLTEADARQILINTADKIDTANGQYDGNGHSKWYGYGRANAAAAVQEAGGGECIPHNEVCDGRDNDCDGLIDEDNACAATAAFCEPCQADNYCKDVGATCIAAANGGYCGKPCTAPDGPECAVGAACQDRGGGNWQCSAPSDDCGKMAGAGYEDLCKICAADADCGVHGLCVTDVKDQAGCAIACGANYACPAGNECFNIQSQGGQSLGSYCFPASQECQGGPVSGKGPCEPCTTSDECGVEADLCLNYGSATNPQGYCALDCTNEACPQDYVCQTINDNMGNPKYRQCMPASGSCTGEPPDLTCDEGLDCTALGGGTVAVCVPPDFDGQPAGTPGAIFGACDKNTPCSDGLCVTWDIFANLNVCLAQCDPATAGPGEGPACPELLNCLANCAETGLECQNNCWNSNVTVNCSRCLETYDQCLSGNGCYGPSGNDFDEQCERTFCAVESVACFGEQGSGEPPGEGDPCTDACATGLICVTAGEGQECRVPCEIADFLCADGRLCLLSAEGLGYCGEGGIPDGGVAEGEGAVGEGEGGEGEGEGVAEGEGQPPADAGSGADVSEIPDAEPGGLDGNDQPGNLPQEDNGNNRDSGVANDTGCNCRVPAATGTPGGHFGGFGGLLFGLWLSKRRRRG